jgi:hypothetical protein
MKTLLALAVAATLLAGTANAACTYPKAPNNVPDGTKASLDEMLASQKEVKAFDSSITEYQACLQQEHDAALAANPDMTEDQKNERAKILVQKQNAAVDEAQGWADRLNAQIRAYREANAKK